MTHEPATLLWGLVTVLSPVWVPFAIMLIVQVTVWLGLNIDAKRVGGLQFIKVGRLCFSYCITKRYTPFN